MEALRDLVIQRTGYPRHGALSKAARDSGVAESQLSRIATGIRTELKPKTLRLLAEYLEEDYNALLLKVYGDTGRQRAPRPTSPHEDALRTVDVIAAEMQRLRRALEAMGPALQPYNIAGKDHSFPQSSVDYIYQTGVVFTQKPPMLTIVTRDPPFNHPYGGIVREPAA